MLTRQTIAIPAAVLAAAFGALAVAAPADAATRVLSGTIVAANDDTNTLSIVVNRHQAADRGMKGKLIYAKLHSKGRILGADINNDNKVSFADARIEYSATVNFVVPADGTDPGDTVVAKTVTLSKKKDLKYTGRKLNFRFQGAITALDTVAKTVTVSIAKVSPTPKGTAPTSLTFDYSLVTRPVFSGLDRDEDEKKTIADVRVGDRVMVTAFGFEKVPPVTGTTLTPDLVKSIMFRAPDSIYT